MMKFLHSKNLNWHNLILGFLLLAFLVLAGCGSENPNSNTSNNQNATNKKNSELTVRSAQDTIKSTLSKADEDLISEKQIDNYRVGISLQKASPIYRDDTVISDTNNKSHQIRILLREKRSKRHIPGASMTIHLMKENGNTIFSKDLLETMGTYSFYGTNIKIPENAKRISIESSPPRVGRHADMKEDYRNPVKTQFKFTREEGNIEIVGTGPQPVDKDYKIGSGVKMALEESQKKSTKSPYHMAFIAEHSEPFWIPSGNENSKNKFQLSMGSIPEDANRHLEIVLLERNTFQFIPHANIELNLSSSSTTKESSHNLPFLLSAFYHYGNSLHADPDRYKVSVSIDQPELHSLEPNKFPDNIQWDFQWEAGDAEKEDHGHDHSH